jgi:2,4-dienoyl-CoA reductase-like NADH-dependent reductase (Old Yellow Enzyme family)
MKKVFSILMVAVALMVAAPAQAQLIKFGVKGGLNLTEIDMKGGADWWEENTTGFFIGPMMEVTIPVIGLGGIMNWRDAVEFMLAGASAVQIGTANFIDPAITIKVAEGINDYLDRHGFTSVKQIIGALEV